jgi:DMSO/TMAO reductase YedYZ molybdopterin-dependent catalytic subunit
MTWQKMDRRGALQLGSATIAALFAEMASPGFVFPDQTEGETLVPFLDMPRTPPNRLDWETLDEWITPQDQVFNVQHYNVPSIDDSKFALEITGLVKKPAKFTMDEIKKMPRSDQLMTLECSGNGSQKGFMNAIYNSKWTGTLLGPLLKSCEIDPKAIEVAFIGADHQKETLRKGTPRETTFDVPFGRSLSLADALNDKVLLAYERNGQPLEKRNGAPLRLIVPGWYGIANVKWLHRIELRDRRYVGRFMGRDYVTVRGERRGKEILYVETSVGKMNLKSIIARVTQRPATNGSIPLKAYGAVWGDGTEVKMVEVQVDDGAWKQATLAKEPRSKYCWTFFSINLGSLKPGKHRLVSRATDVNGRMQPTAKDDEIALKRTYWEAYEQWPREIEIKS